MLLGSAGFCSVVSCKVLWFRFAPLSGGGSFVVWVGFLGLIVRLWVRGFFWVDVWCGVSGTDVVVFQSGSCLGVLHSLRSSVMILLYIFCRSCLASAMSRWSSDRVRDGSGVPGAVGRVTPKVVKALQQGHCLACRWGRRCMVRLPMLVPSASRKDAARVASILSIVRDLSVARPANIRACVFLDMAVNKFECVFFVGSPSSLSYMSLGLPSSALWGSVSGMMSSNCGIVRSVVSEGEVGLCHVAFFSFFVVGFGFEPVARAYASSLISLLVIWLKLVSDLGVYATMRMGNLFESSEYFGRSLSWSAGVTVPFCLSYAHCVRPFHCASLPAGIVMSLHIWMCLFSALASVNSISFSCTSSRSIVEIPWCADNMAFLMVLVASVCAVGSGVEFEIPEVRAITPFLCHGTVLQSGLRPVPRCMGCSFILHFSFCSVFMEVGINVGGSVKVTGVKNSGLVMCWHVVFVYFFIHVRRALGGSAARWVYLVCVEL